MGNVTSNAAIRHMIRESGHTQEGLAADMGLSRSYITAELSRGSIVRSDTLSRIAHACGYRLVLVGHGETIDVSDDAPGDDQDTPSDKTPPI